MNKILAYRDKQNFLQLLFVCNDKIEWYFDSDDFLNGENLIKEKFNNFKEIDYSKKYRKKYDLKIKEIRKRSIGSFIFELYNGDLLIISVIPIGSGEPYQSLMIYSNNYKRKLLNSAVNSITNEVINIFEKTEISWRINNYDDFYCQ